MEDTLDNAPRITTTALSMPHDHERRAEDVPVLEGDDTLTGFVTGSCSRSELWLFESNYFGTVAVIARTEQAAFDWLADYGVLDGFQITEEDARELEEQGAYPMRLGNAGQPFDIDHACVIVSKFRLSDVEHFQTQLTFNGDGWMHMWANNPHNDRPPYRDFFLLIGEGLEVLEYWSPSDQINDAEHAEMLAEKALHVLISNHC
jgi:hypothetical protein